MSLFSEIAGLIKGVVGDQRQNKPEDVKQVKNALNELGYFDFQKEPEPHGYITREMDTGIKRFQKDNGLRVDGWLKSGGETEKALIKNLYKRSISDDIIKEVLPEPNIPGTNIPDRGVPEDYMTPDWLKKEMQDFRFSLDKQIEKEPPLFDLNILLPYDRQEFWNSKNRKKYRDL